MFKSGYLLSYWWTLKVRSCLCDFCCIYKYSFFVSSFPFLRNMQHREQVPRSHEIQLVNFFLWLSKNLSKANDEFHLFLSENNTVINLMWSIEVPFLHVDFKFPIFHLATIGFLWKIKNNHLICLCFCTLFCCTHLFVLFPTLFIVYGCI